MPTPREIITQTSDRLVDQEVGFEFTTWSKTQLLDAFNFALQVVAGRSQSDFAEWGKTALGAGTLHTVPSSCEQLLATGALYAPNGEYLEEVDITRPMPAALKRVPSCGKGECGGEDYSPVGIELNGTQSFRIWPPLPKAGYELETLCYSTPQAENLDATVDVPTRLYAPILEVMMYYAHMYDIEAVPSRNRAQIHWDAAMTLLGGES